MAIVIKMRLILINFAIPLWAPINAPPCKTAIYVLKSKKLIR
jgi:hypothetical protein